MVELRVNTQKAQRALLGADRLFRDLRPFWQTAGVRLVEQHTDFIFETEGYGRWPALNPGYAAWKAQAYPGRGILELTGRYRQAATHQSAPGNVFESEPLSMTWGVSGNYFIQIAGENYPERHEEGIDVPQRQVFGLLATDLGFQTAFAASLDRWAEEQLLARGINT